MYFVVKGLNYGEGIKMRKSLTNNLDGFIDLL